MLTAFADASLENRLRSASKGDVPADPPNPGATSRLPDGWREYRNHAA